MPEVPVVPSCLICQSLTDARDTFRLCILDRVHLFRRYAPSRTAFLHCNFSHRPHRGMPLNHDPPCDMPGMFMQLEGRCYCCHSPHLACGLSHKHTYIRYCPTSAPLHHESWMRLMVRDPPPPTPQQMQPQLCHCLP